MIDRDLLKRQSLSIITHRTGWAPNPDVTQQDPKNRRKQGSALSACRESITGKGAGPSKLDSCLKYNKGTHNNGSCP